MVFSRVSVAICDDKTTASVGALTGKYNHQAALTPFLGLQCYVVRCQTFISDSSVLPQAMRNGRPNHSVHCRSTQDKDM